MYVKMGLNKEIKSIERLKMRSNKGSQAGELGQKIIKVSLILYIPTKEEFLFPDMYFGSLIKMIINSTMNKNEGSLKYFSEKLNLLHLIH